LDFGFVDSIPIGGGLTVDFEDDADGEVGGTGEFETEGFVGNGSSSSGGPGLLSNMEGEIDWHKFIPLNFGGPVPTPKAMPVPRAKAMPVPRAKAMPVPRVKAMPMPKPKASSSSSGVDLGGERQQRQRQDVEGRWVWQSWSDDDWPPEQWLDDETAAAEPVATQRTRRLRGQRRGRTNNEDEDD